MATAKKIQPLPPHVEIDKYLGKSKQRVHRIGIELEGGWTKLPEGVRLTHDGSVRIQNPELTTMQHEAYLELNRMYRNGRLNPTQLMEFQHLHNLANGSGGMSVGELPSPPIEVEALSAWMKIHYPQKVNGTCGMHMHMSFKYPLHYQRLMVPEYQSTILEYVKRWAKKENLDAKHPIWERLGGSSRYCQHKFYADLQARRKGDKGHDQNTPGHRYTVINYAYGRFQTVECRLLPMFEDVTQSIQALEEVLNITNGFLRSQVKKEPIETAHVSLDEDPVREQVTEYFL